MTTIESTCGRESGCSRKSVAPIGSHDVMLAKMAIISHGTKHSTENLIIPITINYFSAIKPFENEAILVMTELTSARQPSEPQSRGQLVEAVVVVVFEIQVGGEEIVSKPKIAASLVLRNSAAKIKTI